MSEPSAAALAMAERVTAAWAMSRHGGSLSAVPLSVCRELERLIGCALEAFAAARVAEADSEWLGVLERRVAEERERIKALEEARREMSEILDEPGTPPKSVLRAWQERVAAALHLLDEDAVVHPNQGAAAQKARRMLRALRASTEARDA